MSHHRSQPLLEGEVVDNPQADELQRLRDSLSHLTRELSSALEENERLKKRLAIADAPVARLRERLEPFYTLLQAIYGDIEEIGPSEGAAGNGTSANVHSPIWNSWKNKLGPQCAKVIDVLLTHREMNTTQLAIAVGTRRQNIPNLIYKLNQAGLINKNGGRFSLKDLS